MGIKNLTAIVAAIAPASLPRLQLTKGEEAGTAKILIDLSQAQWVLPGLLEHEPSVPDQAAGIIAAAAGRARAATSLGDFAKLSVAVNRLVAYLRAHGFEPVPVFDGPRFREGVPEKRPDDDDDGDDLELKGRHALERRLAGCPALEDFVSARESALFLLHERASADDKKTRQSPRYYERRSGEAPRSAAAPRCGSLLGRCHPPRC